MSPPRRPSPRAPTLAAALKADQAARERVRSEQSRSFVVEAGAGTGKTTLLIDRLVNGVVAGIPLRSVAAITFTEKAAGDLKVRLRRALLERLDLAERERDAAVTLRLLDAVADLDSAAVTTIHSFCLGLLREHPFAAGVDPRFAVAAGPMAALLWQETLDDWLARTLRAPPPELAAAIGAGLTPTHLRALAEGLRGRPDCPNLPPPVGADAEAFAAEATAAIASLAALAAPVSADEHGVAEIRRLHAYGHAVSHTLPAHRALALAQAVLGLKRLNWFGTKKHWGPRREAERVRFKQGITALRDRSAAFLGVWYGDLLTGALHALRGALDAYAQAKARRGWLDFDDLLLRAKHVIETRSDVRAATAERWPVILVDEVQDTDPLQAAVLSALAAVPRPPGAPAALTIVGDPKQSLYRFRRADLALYGELADGLVAAGGERVAITHTRRNTPRLAAWVNRVCQVVMTAESCASAQAPWAPRHSTEEPPPGAGAPVLLLCPPADAPAVDAESRRRWEAWRVANLLRRAVEGRAWAIRDRERGPRPAEYGDIALLFRNFSQVEIWEEAFRAAGVPFRVAGGKLFFRRLEVQALASLATAIDDPGDGVAVVAALKGPFIGCSDDDLLRHGAAAGGFDPLRPGDGPCAEPLAALGALHRTRNAEPVADTLARALETFRATTLLQSLSNGAHRVANVGKLLDLARAQEATGLATFRAFARFLRRFGDERGAAEPDSPLAEPGEAAVLFGTVHGAKGLEWPVVVLADVAAGRVNESLRVTPVRASARCEVSVSVDGAWWCTAGTAEAEAAEAVHRDAEERRTFYVACTRARDKLIVPALFGKRNEGYAAYLEEAAEHLGEDADVEVMAPLGPNETRPAASPLRPDFAAGATHQVRRERADWLAGLAAVLEPAPTVPPTPPPAPRQAAEVAAAERARAVGLAVHEVLEHLDLAAPGDLDPPCRAAARAHGVAAVGDDAALARAVAEVRALVERALALSVTRRATRAARVWRELPLFVAETEEGVAHVTARRIDLLFEEAGGKLVLADWKTDAELSPEAEAQYQRQLRRYAGALAGAGRPVAEAWLLMVRTGTQVPVGV